MRMLRKKRGCKKSIHSFSSGVTVNGRLFNENLSVTRIELDYNLIERSD